MEMYGVVNGAYSNHHDRLGEINSRISERNIPSAALRPAFDVRPISSKYATMPILETRPFRLSNLISINHFLQKRYLIRATQRHRGVVGQNG